MIATDLPLDKVHSVRFFASEARITGNRRQMKGLQKEKKDGRAGLTDAVDPGRVRDHLMEWYRDHLRALPWRENRDAYPVMVSEFMLQQTRVEVVVPRFLEFLERFPSVEALARATREQVHDQWSGLGYYRRADLLHSAAQAIAERGGFPSNALELEELPGFGPYTAAAVASIAFDEPVPVLDGNVERVATRLLAESGSPKKAKTRQVLLARLREWIDPRDPGDFNQAMMELGAVVCRPKAPACARCPLETMCRARAEGRPTAYPTQPARRERERWRWIQFVELADAGRSIRLVQRNSTSAQLAGRWELPGFRARQTAHAPKGRIVREATKRSLRLGDPLGEFAHSITHRDYRVELIEVRPERARSEVGDSSSRWVRLEDFDADGRWHGVDPLPASSMLAKAVRILRNPARQLSLREADSTERPGEESPVG